MRAIIGMTSIICVLSGCAPLEFPVVGRTSTGEAMQGTVTANLGSAPGTIEVFSASGLSCTGDYDDSTTSLTIKIPITCTSGATGTVIATRDRTLIKGTAIAQLSDGTSGEFVFGNITAAEQARFFANRAPVAQ